MTADDMTVNFSPCGQHLFQLEEEEEEEELEDKFDISVSVKDPEKIGTFIYFFATRLYIDLCTINMKTAKVIRS